MSIARLKICQINTVARKDPDEIVQSLGDILTDSHLLLLEHIKKRLSRPRSRQPQQDVWQKQLMMTTPQAR
jgi:hypothetical protein